MELKLTNNKSILDLILFLLISSIPLSIVLGNLIINLYIFLISIIYLALNIKTNFFKNKTFLLLFFLFLSLLVNLYNSDNFSLTYPRVLKFLFLIFFILSFEYLEKNKDLKIEKIFKIWSITLFVISIDLLIEYIFGKNIIGFKSYMPGRLSGFFGEELVAGYFLLGFSMIAIAYLFEKTKIKEIYLISIVIILIILSLLIGERSNFIKLVIGVILMSYLILKISLIKKILIIFIISSLTFVFIYFNETLKSRFYQQVINIVSKDGIENYLKSSQYGAHYDTAFKIFEKNKLFGVGIKNFRVESRKTEYYNEEFDHTFDRASTHPHQVHFEFLSETGLFGYVIFLIFILYSLILSSINYIKNKNSFQLAGIIFVLMSLLPYLPSGSFFSTLTSIIFWINYGIMMAYNKK